MSRHPRGDGPRLADILTATKTIASYVSEGEASFFDSKETQDAMIRELEIVGEAAGNVSGSVRAAHPEVPWRGLRGFATFAKHESWKLDLHRDWAAATRSESIRSEVAEIQID